jgi:lipopolysaccharide/colanic/teichoic acid biosynthesis glycosyltransferase
MWQANGRSEITDFEKVVELDTTYIREWHLALDLKILFKTVLAVFKREGSM